VLDVDRGPGYGSRTCFLAGLLDWVGDEPPTAESIAGTTLLEVGHAHIDAISGEGGAILGERPLEADGLTVPEHEHVLVYWRIRGFSDASMLGELPHLRHHLRPLVGHDRAVCAHLGGAKKNAAAQKLLGLPEVEFDWDSRDDEK